MVTHDDIRAIALALPDAYEDTHRRAPAFRVNKRIFGMLSRAGELTLKLEREDQLNMIAGNPQSVAPGRHYSHHGWTSVRLDSVDRALLEILVRLAWTHVAPKRLVQSARG